MADVYFMVGSDFLSSQMGSDGSSASAMPQKIPAHKWVLVPAFIKIKKAQYYLVTKENEKLSSEFGHNI